MIPAYQDTIQQLEQTQAKYKAKNTGKKRRWELQWFKQKKYPFKVLVNKEIFRQCRSKEYTVREITLIIVLQKELDTNRDHKNRFCGICRRQCNYEVNTVF